MSDPEKPWYLQQWGVFLIFGVVLASAMLLGYVPAAMYGTPPDAATFGDSFGFVNALLSAFAFAAVILTLVMQSRELEMQREELRQSREQYEKMVSAQQESENRLFLTAYLNALDSLRELTQERRTAERGNYGTGTLELESILIQNELFVRLRRLVANVGPEIESIYARDSPRDDDLRVASTFANVLELVQRISVRCHGRNTVASLDETVQHLHNIHSLLSDVEDDVNGRTQEGLRHAMKALTVNIEQLRTIIDTKEEREEFERGKKNVWDHIGSLKLVTNCIVERELA